MMRSRRACLVPPQQQDGRFLFYVLHWTSAVPADSACQTVFLFWQLAVLVWTYAPADVGKNQACCGHSSIRDKKCVLNAVECLDSRAHLLEICPGPSQAQGILFTLHGAWPRRIRSCSWSPSSS